MYTRIERSGELDQVELADLRVGDSLYSEYDFFGWEFIMIFPSQIAHLWVSRQHSDASIAAGGFTPENYPMKDWQRGVGIVVGTSGKLPGEEQVCVLQKTRGDNFHLYRSRETRAVKIGVEKKCQKL